MTTPTCQLRMIDAATMARQIAENAPWAMRMAVPATKTGRVVICGAGPSLLDNLAALEGADEVWACNSALPVLLDRGIRVTHGFAIDQGEAMLAAHEFGRALPVDYYLASSVAPALTQHLVRAGRAVTFFHNYLGLPDPDGWSHADPTMTFEMFCYRRMYPLSVAVGRGLNAAVRAACLALVLGFASIDIVGADCAAAPAPPMPDPRSDAFLAWLGALVCYADGRTMLDSFGPDSPIADATINGRTWYTRPDMVISARHLVELVASVPDRLHLVGDTLPAAIAAQGPEFLAGLPDLSDTSVVHNFTVRAR